MHDLYLQRVCLYFLQEHSLAYKVKKKRTHKLVPNIALKVSKKIGITLRISMTIIYRRYNLRHRMGLDYSTKLQMTESPLDNLLPLIKITNCFRSHNKS